MLLRICVFQEAEEARDGERRWNLAHKIQIIFVLIFNLNFKKRTTTWLSRIGFFKFRCIISHSLQQQPCRLELIVRRLSVKLNQFFFLIQSSWLSSSAGSWRKTKQSLKTKVNKKKKKQTKNSSPAFPLADVLNAVEVQSKVIPLIYPCHSNWLNG